MTLNETNNLFCEECEPGFSLNWDDTQCVYCGASMPGCSECESTRVKGSTQFYKCTACVNGAPLTDGECIWEGCDKFWVDWTLDPPAPQCEECSDFWGLIDKYVDIPDFEDDDDFTDFQCDECTVLDGHCIDCGNVKDEEDNDVWTCFECGNGRTWIEDECVWPRIEGCKTYNSTDGSCTTCDDGFWKNTDGLCQPCSAIEGCTKCIKNQGNYPDCTRCAKDFSIVIEYFDQNIKQHVCRPNRRALANCLVSDDSQESACAVCREGFKLVGQECVSAIPNCEKPKDGVCYKCSSGFEAIRGVCVSTQCSKYDNLFNCLDCKVGLFSQKGRCVKECAKGYKLNGARCEPQCKEGEYLEGAECKTCAEGCGKCLDSRVCLECKEGEFCGLMCPPEFKYDYQALKCVESCPLGTVEKLKKMPGMTKTVCECENGLDHGKCR